MGRCKILRVFAVALIVSGSFSADHSGNYVAWIAEKYSKIVCVEASMVRHFECFNAAFDTVDVVFRLGETKFDLSKNKNLDTPTTRSLASGTDACVVWSFRRIVQEISYDIMGFSRQKYILIICVNVATAAAWRRL